MLTMLLGTMLFAVADPPEPVVLELVRGCTPLAGQKQVYDAEKKEYGIQIKDIARFTVKSVADDLEKRPVVLRINGMLDKPEGPLELQVGGKKYSLHHTGFDKELVNVTRKDGLTTIEFLAKGKALLKPGAVFQYVDVYRN